MQWLKDAMIRLTSEHSPVTCRQLYYLLVSAGEIVKTEAQYRAVIGLARDLRRSGEIPWEHIVDQTRWV
jgi:hypothetical protein